MCIVCDDDTQLEKAFGNPQYPNKNPNPEFQHTFAQEKPIFDNENLIKYWEPQIMGRPTK